MTTCQASLGRTLVINTIISILKWQQMYVYMCLCLHLHVHCIINAASIKTLYFFLLIYSEGCLNLEHIDLSYCAISKDGIKALVSQCKRLKHIIAKYCGEVESLIY